MIKINRNGYNFWAEKENGVSHFFVEENGSVIDTHFLVYNDGKYITLQDNRKSKHEYITYALKNNKYRMLDNIIERYERNKRKQKAMEKMK
jgi:hypothetical protein